jgi:hypothetical protein
VGADARDAGPGPAVRLILSGSGSKTGVAGSGSDAIADAVSGDVGLWRDLSGGTTHSVESAVSDAG